MPTSSPAVPSSSPASALAPPSRTPPGEDAVRARMRPVSKLTDTLFAVLCFLMASVVLVLVIIVGAQLSGGFASFGRFGGSFLTGTEWNPNPEHYRFGALPFIWGTLVTSGLALLIATPLSVGTAIFLTEIAPGWVRQPLIFLVEMLAAVPSVILGLWGIFVLLPLLPQYLFPVLQRVLGFLPFFQGSTASGYSVLSAALLVAIMILPIITSVSREILRSVPDLQREAAYGLGATRWEVIRIAVLSYARRGILGAMILGLGRALGETMAVTMVIGNSNQIALSLFQPGNTLASVVASQFSEARDDVYRNALVGAGLVLFGVTLVVNLLARVLVSFSGAQAGGAR